MTVYLDTSVILSKLLNQSNQLAAWGNWETAYSSLICRVEFYRTVDRLRLEARINDEERTLLHRQFNILLESLYRIPLTESILSRAAEPFPTIIGSLDAIHLASALSVAHPERKSQFLFLTHDIQLARTAETAGYQVGGI